MDAIEHLITSIDVNGDGDLAESELRTYLGGVGGASLDEAEEISRGVQSAMTSLDRDQDATVEPSEMRAYLSASLAKYLGRKEEVADWARHALQLPEAMVAVLESEHVSGYDFAELIDHDGEQLREMLAACRAPARLQRKLKRAMQLALLGVGAPPSAPLSFTSTSIDCQTLEVSWSDDGGTVSSSARAFPRVSRHLSQKKRQTSGVSSPL